MFFRQSSGYSRHNLPSANTPVGPHRSGWKSGGMAKSSDRWAEAHFRGRDASGKHLQIPLSDRFRQSESLIDEALG